MKILLWIACLMLFVGCSGPEHVSVAEFKKEYAWVGQPQSMKHVTFLGPREGSVFLKISSMPLIGREWKDRVIFVKLDELDDSFRLSLPQEPKLK